MPLGSHGADPQAAACRASPRRGRACQHGRRAGEVPHARPAHRAAHRAPRRGLTSAVRGGVARGASQRRAWPLPGARVRACVRDGRLRVCPRGGQPGRRQGAEGRRAPPRPRRELRRRLGAAGAGGGDSAWRQAVVPGASRRGSRGGQPRGGAGAPPAANPTNQPRSKAPTAGTTRQAADAGAPRGGGRPARCWRCGATRQACSWPPLAGARTLTLSAVPDPTHPAGCRCAAEAAGGVWRVVLAAQGAQRVGELGA